MNRIAILAAAAVFIGLPASAESIRVSTAGKSPEQIRAEVHKAAVRLCARETVGASFPLEEMSACVNYTVRTTLAQSSDPQLKVAQR
jgi:hypothetical protein